MEPKPAPPLVDDIDQAPGASNQTAEDSPAPMPQITPAGLPNLNTASEEPAQPETPAPDDPKHQQLEQAAKDLSKTPVPKSNNGPHVGLIIFATIFVVSALSVLAIYAYLQSK